MHWRTMDDFVSVICKQAQTDFPQKKAVDLNPPRGESFRIVLFREAVDLNVRTSKKERVATRFGPTS